MNNTFYPVNDYRNYLAHYGVKGMKWGVRRYMDDYGHLTAAGRARAKKDGRGRLARAKIIAQGVPMYARERVGQFVRAPLKRKISTVPYFGSGAMAGAGRAIGYTTKRLAEASEPGSRRQKYYNRLTKNATTNTRYFDRQFNSKSWDEYKDREERQMALWRKWDAEERAEKEANRRRRRS